MKRQIFRHLMLAALLLSAAPSFAEVSGDLESLASNKEINDRAARLDNRARIGIVQGRAVDRRWRLEVGTNYGPVAVGDSYLTTYNLGGNVDLHITPKFSLGVRYSKMFNQLTSEGRQRFEAARNAQSSDEDYRIPDIDHPIESIMGVFNWYPMYGKINFFDIRVVQFDLYTIGGYGQLKLSSGSTPVYTAGGGIGFWLTNHITSRIELRYQGYKDQVYNASRDMNQVVASFGLGVLL